MFPCPSCHRHTRVEESACPFCGAALITIEAVAAQHSSVPSRGLQSLAFGLSLTAMTIGAMSGSGCTDDGDDSTTSEVEAAAADYGGPEDDFTDVQMDTTDTTDATDATDADTTDTGTGTDSGTDTGTDTGTDSTGG